MEPAVGNGTVDKEAIAALPAQQVLEELHSSPDGLSQAEAESHRATSGFNTLTKSRHTALDVLGRQLKSSLIYLLAIASIVSFAIGDLSDGIMGASKNTVELLFDGSSVYRKPAFHPL